MKRTGLLASAAFGVMASPVAAEAPLRIGIAMRDDATATITIDAASFVLPDERQAMVAALDAMPDRTRPVTLSVAGKVETPYRVIGGVLYLVQSAGFSRISVVTGSPVD